MMDRFLYLQRHPKQHDQFGILPPREFPERTLAGYDIKSTNHSAGRSAGNRSLFFGSLVLLTHTSNMNYATSYNESTSNKGDTTVTFMLHAFVTVPCTTHDQYRPAHRACNDSSRSLGVWENIPLSPTTQNSENQRKTKSPS